MAVDPYWGTNKYDWDSSSGNLKYIGRHKTVSASENDRGWYIWKLLYDSNNHVTNKTGPVIGQWTARESLL